MPDYAQLAEDEREREEDHCHAASDYKAGWDAFCESGNAFLSCSTPAMRAGWNAARDATITADRKQQREPDGDILFA